MSAISTTTRPTTEPTVFGAILYLTGLIVGKLTKLAMDFAGGFKETASNLTQPPNLEKIAQSRKWSSDDIENIPAVLRKTGQSAHDWLDKQKAELTTWKEKRMNMREVINQNGLQEIHTFLLAKHKFGANHSWPADQLMAWAADAGNPAIIEIRSYDSASGHAEILEISDAGIDKIEE